jgi:TonB family protein
MGLPLANAIVIALFIFAAHPLKFAPQEYGDSPRPHPVSRLHMTESGSAKYLLTKVEPDYPADAKSRELEGNVTFRVIIGKDGKVKEIHLRRGDPDLIEAAAKALSRWQYETIELDGKPVEVDTFATVRFRLTKDTPGTAPR